VKAVRQRKTFDTCVTLVFGTGLPVHSDAVSNTEQSAALIWLPNLSWNMDEAHGSPNRLLSRGATTEGYFGKKGEHFLLQDRIVWLMKEERLPEDNQAKLVEDLCTKTSNYVRIDQSKSVPLSSDLFSHQI
jgi:hypothetical protein